MLLTACIRLFSSSGLASMPSSLSCAPQVAGNWCIRDSGHCSRPSLASCFRFCGALYPLSGHDLTGYCHFHRWTRPRFPGCPDWPCCLALGSLKLLVETANMTAGWEPLYCHRPSDFGSTLLDLSGCPGLSPVSMLFQIGVNNVVLPVGCHWPFLSCFTAPHK